jgi:hypothetical protein
MDGTTIEKLSARNAELEAFRARVANLMSVEDCIKARFEEEGNENRIPTRDEIDAYVTTMDEDRLVEEYSALEALIEKARDLAADDKEGGAS